jgi:AraC-like DNA-binding protein
MDISLFPTIIYSFMLGITAFALLETRNKPGQKQTLFLRGLLCLLFIHSLGELYLYSGAYIYAPALTIAHLPVRVLLGPALYFYACATMSPEAKQPVRSYLIALLGPVFVSLAMLPFVLGLSSEEKLALVDPATRNPEHYQQAIFVCVMAMSVFVLFTASYLFAALRLHEGHRTQLMERFSAIEQRSLDWFRVILILWGVAWLAYAIEYLLTFVGFSWFGSGIMLPLVEGLILMAFANQALKQPILKKSDKGAPTSIKPRSTLLSEQQMQEIALKIKGAMSQNALFMGEDFSLNRLSNAIAVSENHISETLSQCLHTNFFQFVNRYRVEAAKTLLKESDKRVSTIAFEVGFNTKSTFNAAFKKVTGETPTSYRS